MDDFFFLWEDNFEGFILLSVLKNVEQNAEQIQSKKFAYFFPSQHLHRHENHTDRGNIMNPNYKNEEIKISKSYIP